MNNDECLGPADGAIFRSMFPTPKPGEKAPYTDDGTTLEEQDAEFYGAIEAAQKVILQNRITRDAQGGVDDDNSSDKK